MSPVNVRGRNPLYMQAAEELRKNEGQWRAYNSTNNCVVLAGPGSGKTKTLTIKMARMLGEDVRPPRGIACITYNNQCVRELKNRLSALGIEDSRRAFIGTLHSFCLQNIVLPYGRLAGKQVPDPLKVASADERYTCLAEAVELIKGPYEPAPDWDFRCSVYRRTHLDREKPEWYGDNEDVAKIIESYEAALSKRGVLDFDGMILIALNIIEQNKWVRRALKARFPILVVDEYQDLGQALHRLVFFLCFEADIRVFAVGDPDQSIYGFSGAEPHLLLDLAERDGMETVELKLNYRCGPTIIRASQVALGMKRDFESGIQEQGTLDIHYRPLGLDDQVQFICDTIIPDALTRREKRQIGDIAVLYRDRYDGDVIARAAEDRGWDFIRIDQGNPYPRSPVIYWLEDCAAWCSYGWRIGKPRLSELIRSWQRFNVTVFSDAERRSLQRHVTRFLYNNRNSDLLLRRWLTDMLSECLMKTLEMEPTLIDDKEAVLQLQRECSPGARLAGFTISAFGGQRGTPDHLNLMTLHSAKGLEFDVVVIMGLEEGRIPNFNSTTTRQLLEERRLFYVGLTRARHEVHLACSGWYRNRFGTRFNNGVSRFVKEVKKALNC